MQSVWRPWKPLDANIMDGTLNLNRDFKEFIESLNANQVRYLVVGGYAQSKQIAGRYQDLADLEHLH